MAQINVLLKLLNALGVNVNPATEDTLAQVKVKTDNIPAQGQALAAASLPVVLPAAQITTLTPPAAITGFATAARQLPDGHNVTVAFPATQPVSAAALPLPSGAATAAKQLPDGHGVTEAAQLVQGKFDYIALSNYTTDNQPQTVTYKSGGSAGTTVATLTLVYSLGAAGGNLSSVTKS